MQPFSHAIDLQEVNLDKIQSWIAQRRLDPSKPITLYELCKSKIIGRVKDGVKLLARGATEISQPIHIVVSRASQSAIHAVEAAGGTVTTRFYTPVAVRRVRSGQMHPYISMKWDPAAIGNQALIPQNGTGVSLEERVTGLGYAYRLPDPAGRKELEYYRDVKNRGYLSHLVGEKESPSLFWKPPLSEAEIEKMKKGSDAVAARQKDQNKLW